MITRRMDQYKEKYRGPHHVLEVRPGKGPDRPSPVVRHRAAAVLAGPVRRRQEGERRMGVLQLVQHRDGDRRRRTRATRPLRPASRKNDMDYLHVVNWKKAEEVCQGRASTRSINGMNVIPLETAIAEGLLYFMPEPKSPHGVDVTPDGEYIIVGGKLDTARHRLLASRRSRTPSTNNEVDGQGCLRRPGPRLRRRHGGAGGARPGPAAHPVRRQGLRLHQRCSWIAPWPAGRWAA